MSDIPGGSVCARCGRGVHNDEEGRVVCDGCNRSTETCDCESTG
jgi:hypothetical protein